MRSIGINPWRFETIQTACANREHVPFADIMRFEQEAYYEDSTLHYAQGWAMVYFLRESKEVRRRREWASILPTYFETLKRAYPEELFVIVEEGLTDENFIAERTTDYEELKANVADYAPAKTAGVTGIDAATVRTQPFFETGCGPT